MDHILYQILQTTFNIYLKKHGEKAFHPSIRTYINKIENVLKLKQAIISNSYLLEQWNYLEVLKVR